MVDVPYAAAQVVPSVLGGHVDAMVMLPAAVAAHLQGGRLRAIAALTQARDPGLPEVPTAQELGINVALEAWRGIAVPKGVQAAVVATLENAIRQTVQSPEFAQGTEKLYVRPAFLGTTEFGEMIAKEDADLARIMQAIGLKK